MWIDKISEGVLKVQTPVGSRYIKPELSQRLYLLWIFRHFEMLPLQVLSRRQQRLIDALCTQHRYVSAPPSSEVEDAILGTVDCLPRAEEALPASRSSSGVRAAAAGFAGGAQHRS